MSTFDGERHLREQIDSILAQQGVRVRLVVRDDGSTDSTLEVLRSYDDPRIVVRPGENLGLPHAFFRLLEDSGDDADLWALADQDDVWLSNKLRRAAERLAAVDGPALYCARVLVTDEQLRPLYEHQLPKRGPSFSNALVQNVATGCTIVLDRQARALLRGRWPAYAVMHDAWLYLVLAALGTVVHDPSTVVLYRQHAENAVGMGRGRLARVAGRVRRQLAPGGAGGHGRQDAELLRTHGDLLTEEVRARVESVLRSRWRGEVHRQTRGSDLVLRGLRALRRV